MRYVIFYFFLFFMNPLTGWSQQWAGPDTSTCGKLGVMIGSNDPCEDCCYIWSPSDGLDDAYAKNPIASPNDSTVYTVEVTDKYLKYKGTDQVIVRIGFGNMKFSRDYLIQGDPERTVRAQLLKHVGINNGDDITWEILEPSLNCSLVEENIDAILTPGDMYGRIVVKASKNAVPGCYVVSSIDVNNGVKDVIAIDPMHQGRRAGAGQVLHIIDHNLSSDPEPVIIHAIPNPGGFKNGIPDWKTDTHGSNTPDDGSDYFQISENVGLVSVIESDYIAGDAPDFMPQVKVFRYPTQSKTEQALSIPLQPLIDRLEQSFRFNKYPENNGPACASWMPFTLTVTAPVLKSEITKVEKYNDPLLADKEEISIEMAINAAGRIYHPVFTKSIDLKVFPIVICSRLYAELQAGTSASIKIVKDPSKADGTWKPEAAENEVAVNIGVSGGLYLGIEPPGFNFLLSGTINHSYKVSLYLEGFNLYAKGTMDPLSLKFEAKIQELGDMGKYEDIFGGLGAFSKTIQVFDKKDTVPYSLLSLPN